MNRNRATRNLNRLFFAAATVAIVLSSTGTALAATLRPNVVVHDEAVRLRDIFDGAGQYRDTILFHSPAPGESILLPGRWLHQVARTYALDWRPAPGLDESRVKRSSNRVGPEMIVAALTKALEGRFTTGKRYDVTLDNPGQEIHLPVQLPSTVAIRNLSFDPRSNRYSATIMAPDDRPGAVAMQVAGRVHEVVAVPVLSRRFRTGEIIRAQDLDTEFVRTEQMSRGALLSSEQIVGKSARRPLLNGRALSESDIREPRLVSRGSMVIMRYQTANMIITAHGTARENGTAGETVRVRNTNSGKIVEAIVTGPDSVTVMSLTQSLAQSQEKCATCR